MSRILVLDDEPRIVSMLSRVLSAEGFSVDTAYDGLHGLSLANSGDYDLVLLDLRLPELDGVSVLQRLMQTRPHQSVLVLSAIGSARAKVRCLELGAVDYLSKPFDLTELVLRVRARLRQPTVVQVANVIQSGTLTLDLRRMTADTGDGPAHLTPREFNVLHHLVARAGKVCTRQELLEDVWGFSFDPGTNVVDVCIGRIRAKLGEGTIETVRSVGYLFQTV